MKPLSESLMVLAERVRKVEESATAARSEGKEALERRRAEIERLIEDQVRELEEAAKEARGAVESWWTETRASVEKQVEAIRADLGKWQAEREVEGARRTAEQAEEDAQAAVALATYCVNVAEYAVLDAALARGEAESLAESS